MGKERRKEKNQRKTKETYQNAIKNRNFSEYPFIRFNTLTKIFLGFCKVARLSRQAL